MIKENPGGNIVNGGRNEEKALRGVHDKGPFNPTEPGT
jgi:hypothetical protein